MEEIVLVEALFNGDRDARIEAATELRKLASSRRRKLADKGVIVPLISMLCCQDYEAIEAALNALLSLAFGSERNKIRITQSGAVPVLLNLVQCENMQIIELTIAALLILSSCTANKQAISSSGAVQFLVQFISGSYISISYLSLQVKLDTIATLHNLSTYNTIPSMVSSGIMLPLLHVIYTSEKSACIVEKTMGLIERLVSSSETALEEAAGASWMIQELVEMIEEGSAQCKEDAVSVLFMICKSCRDRYRGLILREGAMPGLLQLSVDGSWRAKEVARELLMILRDCEDCRSVRNEKQLGNQIMMERVMEEIDGSAGGERVVGKALRLVQEMITKLKV